jgi:thioredoxin-related protein
MNTIFRSLTFLALFIPFNITAQNASIQFQTESNWDRILAKAKKEGKFIFVDCFTTWCAPCKEMDKTVYSTEQVVNFFRDNFVSVKVQLDTGQDDNEGTKNWYGYAQMIKNQYKINEIPTFIFFSPEGKIVHRDHGYKKWEDFIKLAKDAMTPSRQYYTLLKKYKNGEKNYSMMPYLALSARNLNEGNTADSIAQEYMTDYLLKLNIDDLIIKGNLKFISIFMHSSKDPIFPLFYKNAAKINQMMFHSGYSNTWAEEIVCAIITKEELDSELQPTKSSIDPDWESLSKRIMKKYDTNYVDRCILDAKIKWFYSRKVWPEITKYSVQKVMKFGIDSSRVGRVLLNNMLYDIVFKHSKNINEINKGIEWMELLLKYDKNDAIDIDTYANLLYKSGRTDEAIAWEKKAVQLVMTNIEKSATIENDMLDCLIKMAKGQPTWEND